MTWVYPILFASGLGPWLWAFVAARETSLRPALVWFLLAWLAWGHVLLVADETAEYLARCLTACGGVAVLGARRPHLGAWNFVVAGFLAVMLLPLAEAWFLGTSSWGPVRTVFLGATLAITVFNYLPTRLGPAAALGGLACGTSLVSADWFEASRTLSRVAILLVPWLALALWFWPPRRGSAFDRRWRAFRDAFGLVWGLRVREMFHHAAKNAGFSADLTWSGLRAHGEPLSPEVEGELDKVLRSLLRRFGPIRDQETNA